jgi:hypothetical protein
MIEGNQLPLPLPLSPSTDEMIFHWRLFVDALAMKTCILHESAAPDASAALDSLSKWQAKIEEGMMTVRESVEIPYQKRRSLLVTMADVVGAVTGVAAAGIAALVRSSAPPRFRRELLSSRPFAPGVAAFCIAADAAQDFAFIATIDGAPLPSEAPHGPGGGAASSCSSKAREAGRFR